MSRVGAAVRGTYGSQPTCVPPSPAPPSVTVPPPSVVVPPPSTTVPPPSTVAPPSSPVPPPSRAGAPPSCAGAGPEDPPEHAASSAAARAARSNRGVGIRPGYHKPFGPSTELDTARASTKTGAMDLKRFQGTARYLSSEALEAAVNCALV